MVASIRKEILEAHEEITRDPFLSSCPDDDDIEKEYPEVEDFLKKVLGPELYPWCGRGKRTSYYQGDEEE